MSTPLPTNPVAASSAAASDRSALAGASPARGTILIFGASGDLTARKLVPALFQLWQQGYVGDGSAIVGLARREKTDEQFRNELHEAVSKFGRSGPVSADSWSAFARRLHYRQLDISDPSAFAGLNGEIAAVESRLATVPSDREPSLRVAYLATTPDLFVPAVNGLAAGGLIPADPAQGVLRVVFEKPFGTDLASAQALAAALSRVLREDQVYRIDHYLGKETVQNILLFRFGNSIFEPLFNRTHVNHVQITVAESQGMESGRGGYYDGSGALRDVMQNHVLQLLCLVAMEPPAMFRSKEIQDEKLKVLQSLRPGDPHNLANWAVAGQYTAAAIDGKPARGYREEDRIPRDSRTETFVALDVRIDNWRWAGVPFFLRTGKRMPHRVSEIAIQFNLPPLHHFTTVECEGDLCDLVGARPNTLIFRIQPSESISLRFSTKRPGMQYQIHPVQMDFDYLDAFKMQLPEAYERLLLDVLRGDSTLFTRNDELEAAWQFCEPLLQAWSSPEHCPEPYAAGTWGPAAADALLARRGERWRTPEPKS